MNHPLIVPFFIAHQGCPHQCVFCDQVKISGSTGSVPAPAEMHEKIENFRTSAGGRALEVAFFGGSFTSLPFPEQERMLGVLRPYLDRGELASVRVSTRPDAIDPATVSFLRQNGVSTVELGIQSMDDAVLARAGRGHTAGDVEKACRLLSRAGFRLGAQLMPGLPGESAAGALDTMKKVVRLGPDFIRIYPTVVLSGTRLEQLYRSGQYCPLDLDAAVRLCKVLLLEAFRAAVPVVRIGLQPTEELSRAGAVIAGPYHSALRQLVEGELFFDVMTMLTRGRTFSGPVTFYCCPARVSEVVGQKRQNILRLARQGVAVAAVRGDQCLSPLELRMESEHDERTVHMFDLDYTGMREENHHVH